MIRENEFLLFSLFFVVIFGFITGFSSIIFGVLVRLRAPLLPFLALLLVIRPKNEEENTKDEMPESIDESNSLQVNKLLTDQ